MQDPVPSREPRSIAAAVRHGRLGVACAEAMVALALALSICVLLMAIGADAASAAPAAGRPVALDDSLRHLLGAPLLALLGYMTVRTVKMLRGFDPHRAPMRRRRR